ncbi:MAG: rubredoxin [Desulfonatronovibrionaceae bacterium]
MDNDKYECSVCGYVYNPLLASRQGLPRDTSFQDLPGDWQCPQCKTRKKYFVPQKPEKQQGA